MNPILQVIYDLLNTVFAGVPGLFVLGGYFKSTPLELTTHNGFVQQIWLLLAVLSDSLVALLLIVKAIHLMVGRTPTQEPLSVLVVRGIRTIALIHLSSWLGTLLVNTANQVCGLVTLDIVTFLQREVLVGAGAKGAGYLIGAVLLIAVFLFYLVRLLLQIGKRILYFNLLFVLSGPAFLCSFDEVSAPWFSFWARSYLMTLLSQILQWYGFVLGVQLLIISGQLGIGLLILGVAVMGLVTEIPGLLSRFAPTPTQGASGLGSLVRTAALVARFL